jgi:serine phosphatase RsbU (regulator of sigma subunit)
MIVGQAGGALPFGPEDVETVAALGAQVTLALERLRSIAIRGSQRRIKTDLRAAREVQRSLLPREPPASCGFSVRAAYLPCFEVGGDCYDFDVRGPGELTALIGDAAGKGVAAAILMTRVSAEFHGLTGMGLGPGAVLAGLNRSMTRRPAGEGFATALCIHFSIAGHVAVAANAGHVLPVLRRANGEARAFAAPSGAPLGFVEGEAYEEDRVAIERGDLIVLMTDGLLEALGPSNDELGMSRALELVARGPHDADAFRAYALTELDRLGKPPRTPRDDVTMVVVQVG